MNSKALLATTALILALSAVSCGKDDNESSVSIAYGESTNTTAVADTTDEETTTGKTTATTATQTVSGTETTTAETEQTETSATETSGIDTDVTATTSAPTETAPPAVTEVPADTTPENNTPAPEENNNSDNNNNTQPEEPPATQAPEPTTETPTENNTFDFKFTVDNLLNDASGLLSMLGTPNYSGEAPGCTNNGNDVKIYQYDGLEVQCYIDGSTEYIFSIEITSDKYVTDRNIKTGCSRAEVESAYGAGETSGNMTVYYTGNNEMDIEYSGDNVTSIFFYAPV